MKKVIAILLIVIGIALLLIPFIGSRMIKAKSSTNYIDSIPVEAMEVNKAREASFDYEEVFPIDVSTEVFTGGEVNKDLIIGQILSPAINMNLAIFKGTNNVNLHAGAATLRENQVMGEKNYPLAGHNLGKKDELFNRVETVEKGTDFYITDKKTIYHYVIVENKIVPPDSFHLLEDSEAEKYGKPILSLMTCEYPLTYERVFAIGVLEGTMEYNEKNLRKIISAKKQ